MSDSSDFAVDADMLVLPLLLLPLLLLPDVLHENLEDLSRRPSMRQDKVSRTPTRP